MAGKNHRYKKGTLSATPDGATAVAIPSVTGLSYSEGGTTVDVMSDGSELVQDKPLEGLSGTLSVTTTDHSLFASLPPGEYTTLTFDLEQVKTGRGAVTGGDLTFTASNVVLASKNGNPSMGAGGEATYEFEIAGDGDGALYVIS